MAASIRVALLILVVGVTLTQLPQAASKPGAALPALVRRSVAAVQGDGPFDATAGLDPGLQAALARARQAAAAVGVSIPINSGYRSAKEQERLLSAEAAARGSVEEAERWVFPPEKSMHVRGLAIDVNHGPGADWLQAHGAAYGLCKTLAWEWWHFEWRQSWEAAGSCPPPAQTPAEAPGH